MGEERIRRSVNGNSDGNGRDKINVGKTGAENKGGENARAGTDARADAGTDASATPDAGTEHTARKAAKGNNATVNPTALAPDEYERDDAGNVLYKADGITPKKKRGRKPGQQYGASANAAPKSRPAKSDSARAAIASEMLAAQFQILNTGIAFLTKFDDFRLEDSEAQDMANATANVMAQFDYVPDPKVAAVLGLVTTTGMIYGPRVYLYRKHLEKIRKEKRERKIALADEAAVNMNGYDGPLNMGQFSG